MIKIFPIISPQTGLKTEPSAFFSKAGIEHQSESFYNYGAALGERLIKEHVESTSRITIATTIYDLDNLTKGFISTFQPWDYALNIMYTNPGRPFITQTRYEDKGSRNILIIPVHILNEAFTVSNIIKEAFKHATFTKVYVVTPVVVGDAYSLLRTLMMSRCDLLEVITLHIDNRNRYKKIRESSPVYDDNHTKASQFLIDSLSRTK